jgi:hypothetical protein
MTSPIITSTVTAARLLHRLRRSSTLTIGLNAGQIAVGYAKLRNRGLPRVEIYVGDHCPGWCSPHTTYGEWCDVGDWSQAVAKVVDLVRVAPRPRADDMAMGKEPYRRRTETLAPPNAVTPG